MRYALRSLRNSPGFTAIVLVTLALGIGANTAIFSAVHALLLGALPYRDASSIVYVREFWPHEPIVPGPPSPDFANWRANSKLAEQIEGYGNGSSLNLTGVGEPERVRHTQVTAGLLDLIGTKMLLGRNFTREEDVAGAPGAVILSHEIWERRFSSSAEILSRQIQLSGKPYTVVGVLPMGFEFPDNNFDSSVLVPMALAAHVDWHSEVNFRFLRVMARMKPGVTREALMAEFMGLVQQTAAEEPAQFVTMRKDMQVSAIPLRERLTGDIRPLMLMLQAAVAMVLLIGCLNIANLQISRSVPRQKEMAVRSALGAGRWRLARQLLAESLILSFAGAGLGLGLGASAIKYLRAFLPASLHLADLMRIDVPVLLFTGGLAILTGVVTGLAPLGAGSSIHLSQILGSGLRLTDRPTRLRDLLVVAEVAIAIVVLASCGLLIRSFVTMASLDPGFRPKGVLTLFISLPGLKYPDHDAQDAFYRQVMQRAQAIPGVEIAAMGSGLPLMGTRAAAGVSFQDKPEPPLGGRPTIPIVNLMGNYFDAIGLRLVRGRAFQAGDRAVVVINQAFADQYYAGDDAIGKRIEVGSHQGNWDEIVGIAANTRQSGLAAEESPKVFGLYAEPEMVLVLRTNVPPAELTSAAVQAIHAIDPNQPVVDIATMEQRISTALGAQRANMILMSILAALALTLAALGIFGVLAYFVNRRSQEIGIRMALGARESDVVSMILRHGLTLTAVGSVLGLAGAFASTRALKSLLFSTSPTDPATFFAITAVFLLVATGACVLPARRAARIDPATAIRHE